MSKNVYNIVWADDEIDDLLDNDTLEDLKNQGFDIIGKAHDGQELETILDQTSHVDAVIVDANFNSTEDEITNERDTSGLNNAMGMFQYKYGKKLPFFLFSGRTEELLKEIYADDKQFSIIFPRHKRWFEKGNWEEFNEMLSEIKKEIQDANSTDFIIRNRYQHELTASKFVDEATYDFVIDYLMRDYEGTLEGISEPFVKARKIVERVFDKCQLWNLIPPIGTDINGTANYFLYGNYRKQLPENPKMFKNIYEMTRPIMDKPLAKAFVNMIDIIQDASHNKDALKYKVDEYYNVSKDTWLLKSTISILIDFIKWFAVS